VSQPYAVRTTGITGLFELQLDVRPDNRGWFKESFRKDKLLAALDELGDVADADRRRVEAFEVVQNNVSFNDEQGVARGIHAEPWDKYISLATGEAFVAIVELRAGPSFGTVETFHLTPNTALFVPEGCGNSYQALTDQLVYTYLVNGLWSPEAQYTFVNLRDSDLAIAWPIPISDQLISEKDAGHPSFVDVTPIST
jgi:dTDP-4-dehydrorhamnose 3,5-epimerase